MYKYIVALFLAIVFSSGLILYLQNLHSDSNVIEIQRRMTRMRMIGIALMVIALIGGVAALYYYRYISAQMPSDCQLCQEYVVRHSKLRPYTADEYPRLKKVADACANCSEMCVDTFRLLKIDPTATDTQRKSVLEKCKTRLNYAELAKKELERLASEMRDRRTAMWQGAGGLAGSGVVFPAVPR